MVAEPLGMFSVMGAHAVTGVRPPSAAMASIAASTAAAPPMSVFIVSMPAGGFSDTLAQFVTAYCPVRCRNASTAR